MVVLLIQMQIELDEKKRLPQTDELKSYCSLSNKYTMEGVNNWMR